MNTRPAALLPHDEPRPSAPAPRGTLRSVTQPEPTHPAHSIPIPAAPTTALLRRSVGVFGAVGVMVGIIIGSGIFQAPTVVADNLNQPWMVLAAWFAGGVICLLGAFTYAELATMYPESGGVYVFLREGFGRCVAFVFGWTYMLIAKPSAAGAIAVVMAEHLLPLFHINPAAAWGWGGFQLTSTQALTGAALILLTWINTLGVKLGASVAGVLTTFKVLALLAIIVLGVSLGWSGAAVPTPAPEFHPPSVLAMLAAVMMAILWTYDGWSDVGAIAGEVRDPRRSLPFIYAGGALLVTALYLAVNAVYMKVVPLDEMRRVNTVAPLVMQRLVGDRAAIAVTLVVVISTLGSTFGSIITGARVTYAQARDGLMFAWLAGVHPRHATPARALWVQCALSCLAILMLGTFEKLTAGFIFTMWIFYGLAAAAIFVLRVKRPDAPRSFRCPGYPVTPALFVLISAAMTVLTARYIGWRLALPWLGVLLAGVPAYFIWEALKLRRR